MQLCWSPCPSRRAENAGDRWWSKTSELIDSKPFKIMLASWINGYFSGLNQGRLDADSMKHDLRRVNPDTSSVDVYAHCARHPDEFVVNAAKDMYLKLPKM